MTDPVVERAVVSIAQQDALGTAATRLAERFAGTYDGETVRRFLHGCDEEVAAAASAHCFLPLRTERFARERLTVLAGVDPLGPDGGPSGRSSVGTALVGPSPSAGRLRPGGSAE